MPMPVSRTSTHSRPWSPSAWSPLPEPPSLRVLTKIDHSREAQLGDGPPSLGCDSHGIVAAEQPARAHDPATLEGPAAGIAEVEAAVDLEVRFVQ